MSLPPRFAINDPYPLILRRPSPRLCPPQKAGPSPADIEFDSWQIFNAEFKKKRHTFKDVLAKDNRKSQEVCGIWVRGYPPVQGPGDYYTTLSSSTIGIRPFWLRRWDGKMWSLAFHKDMPEAQKRQKRLKPSQSVDRIWFLPEQVE